MTSKLRQIVTWGFSAVLVVSIAYLGYCWWTYSGLYRWLAEMQMTVFGSFDPVITGGGPIFLLMVIFALGLQLSRARQNAVSSTTVESSQTKLITSRTVLILSLLPVLGAGVLGTLARRQRTVTPTVTELDIAQLPSMLPATDRYVVSGLFRPELAVEWSVTANGKTTSSLFIPMVPPSWIHGEPFRVVLHTDLYGNGRALYDERRHEIVKPNQVAPYTTRPAYAEGGWFTSALPGPVASRWTSRGQPLSPSVLVLNEADSSDPYTAPAIALAIFGLSTFAVVGLQGVMRPEQRHRD